MEVGVLRTRGRRLAAGDPLRAIAALTVVIYHFAYIVVRDTDGDWFTNSFGPLLGRLLGSFELGLYLFFVLSGYLIAGPFVRAFVAGAPMPRVGAYARNRFLRIVPPFWIVFTVLMLVHGTYSASPGQILAVYGFAQTYEHSTVSLLIGQAWTLDVEIVFYALVPIAAWVLVACFRHAGHSMRMRVVALALAAVWLASLVFREFATHDQYWQRMVPAMLFAFMPGVAIVLAEIAIDARSPALRAPRLLVPGLVGAGLLVLAVYAADAPPNELAPLPGAKPAVLASLGTGLVVGGLIALQWSGRALTPALDNAPLRWIGERSYGLYLVHAGVGLSVSSWVDIDNRWAFLAWMLLVGIPVSLAAAALLFRFVERPLMTRRHAWRRGGKQQGKADSSPSVPVG